MNLKSIKNLPLCLGIVANLSCNTISNTSKTQHKFREVSRNPVIHLCQQFPINDKFKELHSYTFDHLTKIVEANREVLSEVVKLDKFCFRYLDVYSGDASFDNKGNITVSLSLLNSIANDAQFAFVLAHELSHFLNGHTEMEAIPADLTKDQTFMDLLRDSKVAKNKYIEFSPVLELSYRPRQNENYWRYNSALSRLVQLIALENSSAQTGDVMREITNHSSIANPSDYIKNYDTFDRNSYSKEDYLAIVAYNRKEYLKSADQEKKDNFISSEPNEITGNLLFYRSDIYKERIKKYMANALSPEILANWREQEADEVGLELYLRAGYAPEQASGYFESLLKQKNKLEANALTASIEERPGIAGELNSCTRGKESHPSNCWRIANLKNEFEIHRVEYAKITAKIPIVNFFGNRLEKIKKAGSIN